MNSLSDYEEISHEAKKRFEKIAKKTDSEVIKSITEDIKPDKEKQIKCQMATQVFHESLEMFEEGEKTFDQFIEDLTKVLKYI